MLPGTIRRLARELLTIEATGDAERAQALKDGYGAIGPELQAALGRVADVPIDPVPVYNNIW